MSYYRHHVFFCTNKRDDGRECCQDHDASGARDYVKQRIKALGLSGKGAIRINNAGCLDRCSEGPVLVVYPDETWYTFVDRDDLDEIIEEHLVHGRVVERLRL
ncbi:2Fe-2S ferredoxin [Alkalilimnicola ehrlichii]|uniref:2Fe-2S ferredoxin n=1 Tax=Alkalilimnicola ehrlichii TaxID=351052 RepID=A0A3E0X1X7_9GAMM|nr:(2Fe-2S) ferredoxin domain-containing protein [Alkalilimnicola ehrlichii]RFA31235.1 2Fe-2S ferredoxin [Alkalilimnicola ehrlichii]RFA39487.1 2Fe-2S ferredoxin [Alkalilimnicola ehrlichii]